MAAEPTMIYDQMFTDATGTGGERVNIDYRMQLIKQRQNANPFIAFMLGMNSEGTKTTEFRTFETRPNPEKAVKVGGVAAGVGAGTTRDWIVAAGKSKNFNVGSIVRGKATTALAGQTVWGRVTAIDTATDTLTVKPNDPTLIIAAIGDADEVQEWGNSHQQGSLSPKPSGTKPLLKTFRVGLEKHSWQVSKSHEKNRMYGVISDRDRQRGETEIKHLRDLCKQMYYGDGTVDLTGTEPRYCMTGVLNQITSNVLEYGANLEQDEFFDFMANLHKFKYAVDGNMMARVVFASSQVMNDLSKIVLNLKQEVEMKRVFGVNVARFTWMDRTWDFKEDPTLSEFLPGWAVVVQPRYVKLREFRPTRIEMNIQPNNADYFEDQFLTEAGLETQLEELHGIMKPS